MLPHRVLFDEKTIETRVSELAKAIATDLPSRHPILLGLLTGSFVFLADLVRHLSHYGIEPKVIQAKLSEETFGLQRFKDPEERGSKSILRVRDGDTIVLGGLLRTDSAETKTRVPVLSNIPFLGAAFRHKDKGESQRELIIFITPHIVTEDNARFVSSDQKVIREQSIPTERRQVIDKELSSIEEQNFNSYR